MSIQSSAPNLIAEAPSISINNLKVLCEVIETGSVSIAAKNLNISQPAASQNLKNLRDAFNDGLVWRKGGVVIVTPLARELYDISIRLFRELSTITSASTNFKPSSLTEQFLIGVDESICPVILRDILSELTRSAPNASFLYEEIRGNSDPNKEFSKKPLDVAIGGWIAECKSVRRKYIFSEEMYCLMDKRNPLANKSISLTDYRESRHLIAPGQRDMKQYVFRSGTYNASFGPFFFAQSHAHAPFLIQGTDMVLTANKSYALYFANILGLHAVQCPVSNFSYNYSIFWQQATEYVHKHIWLRGVIISVLKKKTEQRS